ncbi:MAG: aminopeptidase P N-terminal domain-containing protein, partial [Polyangiaceae bacterium]|nr:aminopeptidase P N-terminal domain-containing protein [Polyangiaceae bacterium]
MVFTLPLPSPTSCPRSSNRVFVERRKRFLSSAQKHGVDDLALASGWARARNFAHNEYPFRAESHFLWLVGRHIEGALLDYRESEGWALYWDSLPPELSLWLGPQQSAEALSDEIELEVRPLAMYQPQSIQRLPAILPCQDEGSQDWLNSLTGRDLEAQSGAQLVAQDAQLAKVMVELRLKADEAALEQLRYAAA